MLKIWTKVSQSSLDSNQGWLDHHPQLSTHTNGPLTPNYQNERWDENDQGLS